MSPIKFSFYSPASPAVVVKQVDQSFEIETFTTFGTEADEYADGERMLIETTLAEDEPVASNEDPVVELEAAELPNNEDAAEMVVAVTNKPAVVEETALVQNHVEEEDIIDARDDSPQDEVVDEEQCGREEIPKTDDREAVIENSCALDLSTPIQSLVVSSSNLSAGACSTSTASSVSDKLAAMMADRIKAINNIRSLIQNERENDNLVMAEFSDKVTVMEHSNMIKDEHIKSLNKNVEDLKAKNDDYAQQLIGLTSRINELVDSNNVNVQQISILEQDGASKKIAIEENDAAVQGWQKQMDSHAEETATLAQQLETFKAENNSLKITIEDLEVKNADLASELENFLSSLQEMVAQNATLETQVEELVNANKGQDEIIESAEARNVELLDAVEALTESLNQARASATRENELLRIENQVMKDKMKDEEEKNAATILQLETDKNSGMKDQMAAQKENFHKQMTNLTKSLEDSNASRKKATTKSDTLQTAIEDVKGSASKSADNTASSIGQLEKDLEEEFNIATQLKRGMEDLKKKLTAEENDDDANELEDLLSNLRKIQCWQLSHFQRINKLVTENKEQSRSIQLL